jgi:hypothetical protein
MKKICLLSLFSLGCLFALNAQRKPAILTEPATWELEQFGLPPTFAPAIKYKGLEELRFSPNMFKKDSIGYFTYVFVQRLDSTKSISPEDIKDFLLNYFKGLCSKTAADRKLNPIDTSAIRLSIERKQTENNATYYNIESHVFGVFADGAPVTLHMELKVMKDVPRERVYLLFIVSPQPKTAPMWQDLYQAQRAFVLPVE